MTYIVKHPFYCGNTRFEAGQELTDAGFKLAVAYKNGENVTTTGLVPNSFLSLEELEEKKAEIDQLILEKQIEAEKEITAISEEANDNPADFTEAEKKANETEAKRLAKLARSN
jgi:hypothetical protein